MLHSLFGKMNLPAGLISTIEIKIGTQIQESTLTTPDPIALQRCFSEMHKQDISFVFMEVSSHALVQGRTDYVDFDLAVFSNLSHDHLDFHKTFPEYIKAKKGLFDNLKKEAAALVNLDDPNGKVMIQNCNARTFTYALHKPADFKAKVLSNDLSGLQLIINHVELYLKLIGKFNAYNALAVYGAALILKQNKSEVLRHLSALESAEGRMYVVENVKLGYRAVVDYAHTPDALEKVLKTLKELVKRESKLITVVGCGGNRDKLKRPKMAKIAVKYSDVSIFTSDNPRDEEPDAIIDDMLAGLKKKEQAVVLRNRDREEAIKTACAMAQNGDIILVAGKGHEKYQEIKGQRFPFDDTKILNAVMH
jgi:UDP-N-acetylmuramoyl-L-alanyl-D-glutamate--2,6-diaminopimelate ligase